MPAVTTSEPDLSQLDAERLRELLAHSRREVAAMRVLVEKLTHEMAVLKRMKFAARSESYSPEQRSLLEEAIDADSTAIEEEIDQAEGKPAAVDKRQAKRQPLPAHLPRREVRHEPADTNCRCGCAMKRIGEDISEKLDYVPGVFTVERHVRGKWVCAACETLVQEPVAPHIIDKGIPTPGLLAQVLVAKYADHLPLYRQEAIFARAGFAIPRSTLAQWVGTCGVRLQPLVDAMREELLTHAVLHADETPVPMLKPGKGKTHKAYLWSYCTTSYNAIKAVVFDFAETRAGENAREFLRTGDKDRPWRGTLVCDDFSGYKAMFEQGVTEGGCLAHARRKFHELWDPHKSPVAEQALKYFAALYEVEREVHDLTPAERRRLRQEKAVPIAVNFRAWLEAQRVRVPDGSATAKAIDYSLGRWEALTLYLDDGDVPCDNNWVENQIRPIAIGRSNWLFAGSLRAGKRAAAIMSLIHSARLNGHDPYAYLRDVMERLPAQPASRIDELLPHRWNATSTL
jgi:transposase